MSLLNLKSIFSPENTTKFQDNQSNLTTLDSKFDNGLNIPIKSNLLNLNSKFDNGLDKPILSNLLDSSFDTIFDDGISSNFALYTENQPNGAFDTKLNYNQSSLIGQTYGFDISISPPTLDSLLRGRVYNQSQYSQNFTNDTLFVSPENHPFENSSFLTDSFDTRAPFAKERTLYFNTGFTLSGGSFMNTNDLELNNEFFIKNNPQDKFDTKFDYTTQSHINTTFATPGTPPSWHPNVPGNPIEMSVSPLDNVLRGGVYEQIRFSHNSTITTNRQFVDDINDVTGNHPFLNDSFDPRSNLEGLIKDRTIYQNTGNSFRKPSINPEVTFGTAGIQSPYSGGDIFNSIHGGNYGAGGVDLESLGVSFYNGADSDKNLSWESLYNSNHTPKNNPKWKGGNLEALNYGSIVNRDNLKIGKRDHVIGERYGFSRGDEPYVVSPIGNEGREKNKGGRSVPITRALTDGDRILNFLTSTEGINFALRQNINIPIENTVFSSKNVGTPGYGLFRAPQRFGTSYNPFSSLVASSARALGQSVPNILIRKSEAELGAAALGLIGDAIPKTKIGDKLNDIADLLTPKEYMVNNINPALPSFSINDTFTNGLPAGGGLISQIGDALSSLNPFNPGTVVPKTTVGDRMTLAEMFSGGDSLTSAGVPSVGTTIKRGQLPIDWKIITADVDGESDGMPFYFKDLRDDTYIFFRAFIEGLTENISPTYAPTNYIGRSEPVWTYERAEREISMTLKLVAQTRDELTEIYKKMDRLTSMCYPKYEGDDYGNRMKPPLSKLRYGELYGKTNKELMGYLKSISYSIDQSSTYETESGARVPKHVLATIGYQVIHDKAPRLGTKFYGINQ